MEEYLQVKVKVLPGLYCPTFCLTSVPKELPGFLEGIIQNGNLWKLFSKNRICAGRG